MLEKFNELNRREQLILIIGGVFFVAYLLYILVYSPLSKSQTELAQQNDRARETIVESKGLVAEFKNLQRSGAQSSKGSGQSLSQIVDTTVAKNSLSMKRFQPNASGDAQVRFEGAIFNNIVAWLYELESGYSIIVKDISISPGRAEGLVDVSVRLSQGG